MVTRSQTKFCCHVSQYFRLTIINICVWNNYEKKTIDWIIQLYDNIKLFYSTYLFGGFFYSHWKFGRHSSEEYITE